MMSVGSLFSGIGGLEYGLERTGSFKTIWNCEIEAYPSAVLKKHWSDVPNLGDITKVKWDEVKKPDVICGGFPCQDISVAGKGAGIKDGKRSGLWREFAKAIRVLRPKYALIENVPMLVKRGLHVVLEDLAEIGYDAEWKIISAAECGAPHKRERLFVIAYPHSTRQLQPERSVKNFGGRTDNCADKTIWDASRRPEPFVRRMVHGVPDGLDRINCLGLSVVPACAQICGERILRLENSEP